MKDDIQFLIDLQKELNTQDHDCQAAPRYWTVGDFKFVDCREGNHETYHVGCPDHEYYGDLNALLQDIKEDDLEDMSDEAKEDFAEIECEETAMDFLRKHYDENADLIPVRKEHFVHSNTMFLTKAEAKRHIELNHYHYSKEAHTYAMTAWRAPKVERLINIIEKFDFEKLLNLIEVNGNGVLSDLQPANEGTQV